jgi:hypothetical protein
MFRQTALAACVLLGVTASFATELVTKPDWKVGDSWVVQGTETKVRDNEGSSSWKVRREVTRVEGDIAIWKYEMLPPSRLSTGENKFDIAGQEFLRGVTSGKPERTRFPLSVGSEWKYLYEVKSDFGPVRYEMTARVVGWEEITVPAGTYRALRIEHRGTWSRERDFAREGGGGAISAPQENTYWYAPAAKAMVKILRVEGSARGGVLTRSEQELVEVSVAGK